MATTLDKPLVRETGLNMDGKPYAVILLPSEDGGTIAFKAKGKHGNGIEVPLSKILLDAIGTSPVPAAPEAEEEAAVPEKPKKVFEGDVSDLDKVDLASLERRLAIDASEVMKDGVREMLMSVIREMREEAREEAGAPPVYRGTKKGKKE